MELLLGSQHYYEDDASKYWMEDASLDDVVSYLLRSQSIKLSEEIKGCTGHRSSLGNAVVGAIASSGWSRSRAVVGAIYFVLKFARQLLR